MKYEEPVVAVRPFQTTTVFRVFRIHAYTSPPPKVKVVNILGLRNFNNKKQQDRNVLI